jgi:hypothetical protein
MAAVDFLRVLADWSRDGEFDHPLSDITGRVLSAEWHFGFDAPAQKMSPPAGGTVVLDNNDGAFNVGRAGGLYATVLRRDVLIQFQHTGGTTLAGFTFTPYAITVLRVVDIQIAAGQFGARTVVLTLGDWQSELMSAIYDPPLTLNTTTGVAVASAIAEGLVPLSYAGQYWVLGASVLDVDTVLWGPGNAYSSFYLGSTTLDYVGDNIDRGNGVSLYSFIEEMCAAEMDGRFWLETFPGYPPYSPRPRWRFMGRGDLARYYEPENVYTLPASRFMDAGHEYEYGRTICNKVEVTLYPRTVGSAGTELARSASAFRLRAGENRVVTLRYRDPNAPEGTCSATTIITPVASTDYTANEAQDGSGADLTSSLSVAVENRTSAAVLTINNQGAVNLYVTLLKIRGTPLTARQPLTLTSADAPSIRDYGQQSQSMTIAGVDDAELVQQYADYYIQRNKDPLARYRRVTFEFPETASDPMYRPALILPLRFAGLRITDDWIEDVSGTRVHWVAGAQHTVDGAARTWRCSWFLDDYIQNAFWQLGDSDLGVLDMSTLLGF